MTILFGFVNTLLALLLWLLVMRLIFANWSRGGAIVAVLVTLLILLLRYDIVVAAIAVVLIFLIAPRIAGTGVATAGMRAINAVTDPLVERVRSASGGRMRTGTAVLASAVLVIVLRVALFVAFGR